MSPDMEYIVDQVKAVLAIDSPTSYTKAAASYVLEEYRRLGFQPEMTAKGVGGGSDSAALTMAGVPTVCALGVKGEFNHTVREYAMEDSLFERTKLLITILCTI